MHSNAFNHSTSVYDLGACEMRGFVLTTYIDRARHCAIRRAAPLDVQSYTASWCKTAARLAEHSSVRTAPALLFFWPIVVAVAAARSVICTVFIAV